MPLSELQSLVLRTLAAQRSPESYVAGAAPIARSSPRFSADVGVFHDREDAVETVALADARVLEQAGLVVAWVRRQPALYAAIVRCTDDATRLEWVVDSDFRFFPAVADDLFGYVLHPADIATATNKVLAAAGRREPRDILDLLWINRNYLPLGAAVWAAAAEDPGFTPEGLIAEICRTARYQQADFDRLRTETPVDAATVSRELREALCTADNFVRAMPAGKEGLLFLTDTQPVQPRPDRLEAYTVHAPQRRGHWPISAEIGSAMLDRYRRGKP